MRTTKLHEGWTLDVSPVPPGYPRPQLKAPAPIPAQVPGSVHLDLMAAGIIADPFQSMYEIGVQWVDERPWTYRTAFQWEASSYRQKVLRFECLDTVCSIVLNGRPVGESDNFFLPLEIDVSDLLIAGGNELEIRFESAVCVGDGRRREWFENHGLSIETVMFDERAFVRKPGYMSGWDWGPRLVGAGIVGDVTLIESNDRIRDLIVDVCPEADGNFRVRAEAVGGGEVEFAFDAKGHDTKVTVVGPGEWRVKGPLWWPNGMGDQPLHTVRVFNAEHELQKQIGLRTIELVRVPDEYGECFEFHVNGKRLWARGANWIPNDSFPGRIGASRLEAQLQRYAELNFNMLRVWGGGLYESEAFYDACDRLGILVWQDFPFACMYYPDDAPHEEAVRREAVHQVKRLRHRVSLALWCGNNENLAMWQQKWGAPGRVPDRYCGENLYDRVLPELVQQLDPRTPYVASSPIGVSPDDSIPIGPLRNVGIDGWGDSHYWDVWHGRGDWVHYTESKARFSSEFGFASSCSLEQWREILPPFELENGFVGGSLVHDKWTISDPDEPPRPSAVVFHHERTGKKWETFRDMVELHYPRSETLEDWVCFSQLNQRDALRCGIEHYRRSEFCRGSLIWQANDCWPVMSWAVEDYRRVLKPAGWELQRLYADVMVSVDYRPGDPTIRVWASNDGVAEFSGTLTIRTHDTLAARLVREESIPIALPADSRRLVREVSVQGYEPTRTAVCVTLGRADFPLRNPVRGASAPHERWLFLAEPKAMQFGPITIRYQSASRPLLVEGFVAELIGESGEALRPRTGLNLYIPNIPGRYRSLAGYHGIEG